MSMDTTLFRVLRATYLVAQILSNSNRECLPERSLPNIVIPVPQELSKNIDRHHSQSILRFDFQNSKYSFVEDRVSHILRRFRISRNLSRAYQENADQNTG